MSSQTAESCGSGFGRDNANHVDKRTKRHLSPQEEEILLASLKQLIVKGCWKSDNGFRPGYLNKLEQLMKEKIPNTDLKAIPHLNSKLQAWKRNYNSLTTMLSRSGVGFKDNMIDCTMDQWDEIVKVDPNAKSLRRRSWPMYDEWKEIFGKDRATGDHAEDVVDAVNDLLAQDNQAQDEMHTDYHVNFDGLEDISAWDQSVCGSENDAGKKTVCGGKNVEVVAKGLGKKRKVRDVSETVSDVLLEMNRNTNARLDNIASRIGYEYDLDAATMDAYGLLEKIPDLSEEDIFEVYEIFADNPKRLLVFKGLPETARPHYVQRLLRSKHG